MTRRKKGPGKAYRKGISLIELNEMFPDERAAVDWFESIQWPSGRCCGHCGATNTREVKSGKPMPYWCPDCRSYFSVRTGTTLQSSRLPLRKWAFAVYLYVTNIKGISSMKLHRDIEVTQKTAWFMLHRLREAYGVSGLPRMTGPVEVDETYVGGKRKNMSIAKRAKVSKHGRGGKTAVVGARDRQTREIRAEAVARTDVTTLKGFIDRHVVPGSKLYTDDAGVYTGIRRRHATVNHSVGEYVRDQAHTNGIESFWALLKRGFEGTYHKISPKHLDRYVREFARKNNIREADTIRQMGTVVAAMTGRRLMYCELIADNGLDSGARS